MNVLRLIQLSLADVGITDPDPNQIEMAFDHLNMILSNFSYWNPDDQPIEKFLALTDTIQLPNYYIELFEMLLAAREALTYALHVSTVQLLEAKSKQLTEKLTYRRVQNMGIGPCGMVI